ncbi:sigma-54-dependent Fis family transcriptional regulator [candidate division KSB1 bacterium]|nr:sigma-54-dependent Fis family transcriptional regulator [candidate division KSB1 bacterium]
MPTGKVNIATLSTDNLAQRVKRFVSNDNTSLVQLKTLNQLVERAFSETFDLVLINSAVCRSRKNDNLKILETILHENAALQIIMLTEPSDIKLGLESLKSGVYQYVKLPIEDIELKLLIETALERHVVLNLVSSGDEYPHHDRLGSIVGKSTRMQKVYRQIRKAAESDINVLVTGETGTGKDLAAQTIHQLSKRSDGPFLPVNLGAIPQDLVASELFGHEKGAFTGAVNPSKGIFEKGMNGTVFLDEIEAINKNTQISLLRLIEKKGFQRLGGTQLIENKARLIVSSNENLQELVNKGAFRIDLYYRLDVFRIHMPALRRNPEDIPLLVKEFIARFNRSFNKSVKGMSAECLQALQKHDWPGNSRELKNVIQRAAVICDCDTIQLEHLPPRFRTKPTPQLSVTFEIGTPLDEVERQMILRALDAAGNNRTKAAELLGISRRAIYNKLQKHNIQ